MSRNLIFFFWKNDFLSFWASRPRPTPSTEEKSIRQALLRVLVHLIDINARACKHFIFLFYLLINRHLSLIVPPRRSRSSLESPTNRNTLLALREMLASMKDISTGWCSVYSVYLPHGELLLFLVHSSASFAKFPWCLFVYI